MGIKNKKKDSQNPVNLKIVNDGKWCETCGNPAWKCKVKCITISNPDIWKNLNS